MGRKRAKSESGWISWTVIIGLFVLGLGPIALILLLVKLFAKDSSSGTSAPPLEPRRETVDTRIYREAKQAQAKQNPQVQKSRETVRNMTKTPSDKNSTALILQVIGVILGIMGILIIGDPLGVMLGNFLEPSMWVSDLLEALILLGGGCAMWLKGRFMKRDIKRFANYLAVMGNRDAMSVEEFARILGRSRSQVESDLEKMVEKGYFGEGAYLNRELGYLFRSNAADLAWQEKQRAAQASAPKEAEEGYSGILRNIRRANDEIADPVLSAKIDQLESITARIFKAVEEDPEKAKRIDTFLTYYLPTTQKLLDSYAQFEAAGVEGENLSQAKSRIEGTMDMIIKGFSHQLDELYKMDAMDVDSDIRVMESMLRKDTASAAEDFGFGGTAVQKKDQ